jgi:uncharacterized protein (TIGR01777 family)
LRIVIVGATGLIGRHLARALADRGDEVVGLSRSGREVPRARAVRWDPASGPVPAGVLEGAEAVINLAGAPLAPRRWTSERKREIRDSRVVPTQRVVEAFGDGGPRTLVNASAVGAYGSPGEAPVDESAPRGRGFLADVCEAWEAEALRAADRGVRVVLLRSALVLAADGGVLGALLTPAKLGVAGPLGNGRQWWPWIHVEDEIGVVLWALDTPAVSGPVNAAAPTPARQREVAATLGRILRRPAFLPAPAIALEILLGETSSLLLQSQRVIPRVALDGGYRFRHPELEPALRDLLGR